MLIFVLLLQIELNKKMKTILITLTAAFFLSQAAYSQTEKEQITAIDNAKLAIDNNMGNYQKTKTYKEGANSKSVYKDGNELEMVTIDIIDKNVDKKVEWYFVNGGLIYSGQVWTNLKTGKIIDNEKTYVNNNQALCWIKTNNALVDRSSEEFIDMNASLMAYAAQLEKDSLKQTVVLASIK
jgi:hypothetical protein